MYVMYATPSVQICAVFPVYSSISSANHRRCMHCSKMEPLCTLLVSCGVVHMCSQPHDMQIQARPSPGKINTHLTLTTTGLPPGTAFRCMICLCTCSLHLIISVGQTTMAENTLDMLPAQPCCQGFRKRSSLTAKKRCTILTLPLYARKRTAFSFVAVITAGTDPA